MPKHLGNKAEYECSYHKLVNCACLFITERLQITEQILFLMNHVYKEHAYNLSNMNTVYMVFL
jgi:hypothetical protein